MSYKKLSQNRSSLNIRFSEWLHGLGYEHLPASVVNHTKLRILDVLGNIAAAKDTDFGRVIGSDIGLLSSTWGDTRSSALFLGGLATALDFDDTHMPTMLHCSSPTIVAALITTRFAGSTGRETLTSVAGAIETMCRLGLVAPGVFHRNGFHATGILGAVGSALTSAKLLKLTPDQTMHAIGIAASQTSGLLQAVSEGSTSRLLYAGFAAQNGLAAVSLAASGVTGPVEIFEGERGLFATHAGREKTHFRWDILDDVGERWESENCSFKPYPCGHVIHPFIQAALYLRKNFDFRHEEIETIDCLVPGYAVPMVCEPHAIKKTPPDDVSARVSLQYTVAEALVTGTIDAHSYARSTLVDPAVLTLADKTTYTVDSAFETRKQFGGGLVVRMNDGHEFVRLEPINWGSAKLPMSDEEVLEKFKRNLVTTGASKTTKVIDLINGIEYLDTFPDLVDTILGSGN